jgi:hypothetical protein
MEETEPATSRSPDFSISHFMPSTATGCVSQINTRLRSDWRGNPGANVWPVAVVISACDVCSNTIFSAASVVIQ